MIIPVRCMTCGKPVGQFWEEYNKRVDKGEDPKKYLTISVYQDIVADLYF